MSDLYAGPYLQCFLPKESYFKEQIRCKNEKCKLYDKLNVFFKSTYGKFCNHCGKKFDIVKIQDYKVGKIDYVKFARMLKKKGIKTIRLDRYYSYPDDYDIFCASFSETEHSKFWGESKTIVFDEKEFGKTQEEKEWFGQQFSTEIEILKKLYGEDKVLLKWGVVQNIF